MPNFFDMIVKNSHRLCSRARLGRTEAEWETILWSQFEIHSLTNTTDTEQYVNIVSGTTLFDKTDILMLPDLVLWRHPINKRIIYFYVINNSYLLSIFL